MRSEQQPFLMLTDRHVTFQLRWGGGRSLTSPWPPWPPVRSPRILFTAFSFPASGTTVRLADQFNAVLARVQDRTAEVDEFAPENTQEP